MDVQTHFERLELKYLIDEYTAGIIRSEIQGVCEPDKAENGGYPVTSLYLDTSDMAFHRAKLRDAPDRFKLRARIYSPESPVFLEIKRKCGDVILKRRAAVPRETWVETAHGYGPMLDNPRAQQNVERFSNLLTHTAAEPRLLVHYMREAYASTVDRYARVTFDREIKAQDMRGWSFDGDPNAWTPLDGAFNDDGLHSPVVLELKCEARMPRWMVSIIQRRQLHYQGFSKYSNGISLIETDVYGREPPANLALLREA